MFKNLKIGMRLGLGFGFVLLLLAISSVLSYQRIGAISKEIDDVVHGWNPSAANANDIIEQLGTISTGLRNTLLFKAPEEVQKEFERIAEARKAISEDLGKLEKAIDSGEGKKALGKTVETRKAFVADLDKFLDLQKASKRDEALDLLRSHVSGSQHEYAKTVSELAALMEETAKKDGEQAEELAGQVQNLVLTLGLGAVILAIFCAWWITRSITKPIGEAMIVANELAEGNLTVKIVVDSKDETGMLLTSMSNMVGKLSHIIGEVNTASEALNNAAGQVSQTAQSLSQSSSEQAASVEETTASIEQMTA
ncbi:MAG: MCP four helix bundle domain-containing protein, partial [Proteobacteria bacterium]|nr:MCP four helix bundle domain-containing protein [Pseudomonadota bacterium]